MSTIFFGRKISNHNFAIICTFQDVEAIRNCNSFSRLQPFLQRRVSTSFPTLPDIDSTEHCGEPPHGCSPTGEPKWYALPSVQLEAEESTTALKWTAKQCSGVPHSLLRKLFRKRQVRVAEFSNNLSRTEGGRKNGSVEDGTQKLRRLGEAEQLKSGTILYVPTFLKLQLESNSIGKSTTSQKNKNSLEDVEFLRELVIHKDSQVIVLNKPSGLPVQGGPKIGKSIDSMMKSALSFEYSDGPRLIHRLDMDTSGCLLLGRTAEATRKLHMLLRESTARHTSPNFNMKTDNIQKVYWALVYGIPSQPSGTVDTPLLKVLLKDGKSDRIIALTESVKGATKPSNAMSAITQYRVMASSQSGFTWLELQPMTGRKHQIRVHCASVLGLPIVGDRKYGNWANKEWLLNLNSDNTHLHKKHGHGQSHQLPQDTLHLHCRSISIPNWQSEQSRQSGNGQLRTFQASLPPHMAAMWSSLGFMIDD